MENCLLCKTPSNNIVLCFQCGMQLCKECRVDVFCPECLVEETINNKDRMITQRLEEGLIYIQKMLVGTDIHTLRLMTEDLRNGLLSEAACKKEVLKGTLSDEGMEVVKQLEDICFGKNIFIDTKRPNFVVYRNKGFDGFKMSR